MKRSPFEKGGFRGISGDYVKSPLPPFRKGGLKTAIFNDPAMVKHHHKT
jgi:hypothetical protein